MTQGGPLPSRKCRSPICEPGLHSTCLTRLFRRELNEISEDRYTKHRTSHKDGFLQIFVAWTPEGGLFLFDMQKENFLASLLLFQKIFNHTSCFCEELKEFSSELLEFPFSLCSLFVKRGQFHLPPRNASPGWEPQEISESTQHTPGAPLLN